MTIFRKSGVLTSKKKLEMEIHLKKLVDKFNEVPGPRLGILLIRMILDDLADRGEIRSDQYCS
jgi:hypothetical protein